MIKDETLVRDGLETGTGQDVLILACGALAREILALTDQLSHVTLRCLPAILHNHPEKIPDAVEERLLVDLKTYKKVFVAYADCGTGGQLQAVCERHGVEMIAGPHCYGFFEGNDTFAENGEIDAFYLTDFLARQFDAFVTRPLGLDRHPELTEMYFGNYRKVVYLSQIENPELLEKAKSCAEKLKLDFEHRRTGYGDLATALSGL